jgi:hypothetical protein
VTRSTFHSEDPQILRTTAQILDEQAIWRPEFVHPCHLRYEAVSTGTWLRLSSKPLRNVGNYLPIDTVTYLRRPVSSARSTQGTSPSSLASQTLT